MILYVHWHFSCSSLVRVLHDNSASASCLKESYLPDSAIRKEDRSIGTAGLLVDDDDDDEDEDDDDEDGTCAADAAGAGG